MTINAKLNRLIIKHLPPTPQEFVELRDAAGWGKVSLEMATQSLQHSLFHVTVRLSVELQSKSQSMAHDANNESLIAMGRVIGDGFLFFYIQDIVVAPNYQGQGLGHIVMTEIEDYLQVAAKPGATIGLFSAQGKENFYARYGYQKREGNSLGLGMCRFVSI
ncbi:GNAT family N-acetyltransferase [Aliikangiella maris]|uniref:GNAT family N-acetyltransferase n=2 Tax=Aliikangiella maris TaxID=3162458 RepID=A0ABV3MN12_9GAMM